MTRFMIALLLSMFFSTQANAFTANTGNFLDLEFVASTEIPGSDGNTVSLCYQTQDFRILGYTLTSNIIGYVLSSDECTQTADRPFTKEQVETAQSLNLLDTSIPPMAENDLERNIRNYGIWVALGLGLIAVIIRRLKSLMGFGPAGSIRKKAAERIVTAMCYVGKCDGIVAAGEISLIGKAATRLTRRDVLAADVIRITDHINMNLTTQDYIDFGKGLRDSEKDLMMRGAFYVALSSGRMLPSEHAFLTDLAHGIGMPAEDFRRVMSIALDDLDKFREREMRV